MFHIYSVYSVISVECHTYSIYRVVRWRAYYDSYLALILIKKKFSQVKRLFAYMVVIYTHILFLYDYYIPGNLFNSLF